MGGAGRPSGAATVGSLSKSLRRRVLVTVRDVEEATRAATSVLDRPAGLVTLRRFLRTSTARPARPASRPYTHDRTLTSGMVTVRSCRYGVNAGVRQKLVKASYLRLLGHCFLPRPTATNRFRRNAASDSRQSNSVTFGKLTMSALPSPPGGSTRRPAPRFAPHPGSTERLQRHGGMERAGQSVRYPVLSCSALKNESP